jgi:hypothetical protein
MPSNFKRWQITKKNPELKAALENQAAAYRKLAIDRATKLGNRPPELPPQSNRNTNHR